MEPEKKKKEKIIFEGTTKPTQSNGYHADDGLFYESWQRSPDFFEDLFNELTDEEKWKDRQR